MPAIECPGRHVVGRKDNVVIVDFRGRPEPPTPYFPGGGALRVAVLTGDEALSTAYEHYGVQQQFIA
jgi:hypothetical protein